MPTIPMSELVDTIAPSGSSLNPLQPVQNDKPPDTIELVITPTEILFNFACIIWAITIIGNIFIRTSIGFIEESPIPIAFLRLLFFSITFSCTYIWSRPELQVDHSIEATVNIRNLVIGFLRVGLVCCALASIVLFGANHLWYTSVEIIMG